MPKINFDYRGAKEAGYSDEEITQHLQQLHPKFDYQAATEAGYSPEEINEHLSEYKPKRSFGEKTARIGAQYGIGAAESILWPVEIATAVQTSKPALQYEQRKRIGEDLEYLLESNAGISKEQWPQKDRELYDYLSQQIEPGGELKDEVEPKVTGVRSAVEQLTGTDLHPEGVLEKAANWAGFLKNPSTLLNLHKIGLAPKELTKALLPTGTEAIRGLGAGAALELAEQGQFGPIGTMAAVVVGDLLGAGTAGIAKGTAKLITQPKKTLAEVAAKFTSKEKKAIQQDLIKDFRASGLQADVGTLTDSNLLKMMQSRLAQSGLTGKSLEDFREELTGQIKREYASLTDTLGQAKFNTMHDAGLVAKEGIKSIREADLGVTRKFYDEANKALKESAYANTQKLNTLVQRLEKELTPGRIKSSEQQAVLNTLEKLKTDIMDSAGNPMYASVKDLMNNKIAINDIINYEVQGGAKQLLKSIVGELDRAIISHGKENPKFARNYIQANKKFSEHAKTFRNKEINSLLNATDPAQLMNRMNTVQGIRTLGNILNKTPEGKQIFDALKKTKLDETIGKNLVDSSTQQVKLGTFSKLLEKGKNKEVIREILGKEAFQRLERLQKNAGKLADAANKFYNASKSGTAAIDATVLSQGITAIASVLAGNPWPIVKVGGSILGARKLSGLLADPEFLKLTEQAILASTKGSQADLITAFERLRPYILPIMNEVTKASSYTPEATQQ